jgi:hypothetical protein
LICDKIKEGRVLFSVKEEEEEEEEEEMEEGEMRGCLASYNLNITDEFTYGY